MIFHVEDCHNHVFFYPFSPGSNSVLPDPALSQDQKKRRWGVEHFSIVLPSGYVKIAIENDHL
jgi:hypothetical protein